MIAMSIALWIGFVTVSYLLVITRGGLFESKQSSDIQIRGIDIILEKFLAGILIFFMGSISLASWVYFFIQGYHSFLLRWQFLLPHVLMQLAASLSMLLAGHSIFGGWHKQRMIFFLSLGFTLLVSLVSLLSHGREMHRVDMHIFSTVIQVIGALFAAVIFLIPDVFPSASQDTGPEKKNP